MKVVVDTNVLISVLFGKTLKRFLDKLKDRKIILLESSELMLELIKVLERPKFNALSEEDKKDLFAQLEESADFVHPQIKIKACRDLKDNFILECALTGGADYIITGDKDLLLIDSYKGIKIIPPKKFEDLL